MKFKRPHSIYQYFIDQFKKSNYKNINIKNVFYDQKITLELLKKIEKYNIFIDDLIILSPNFFQWFCEYIVPNYLTKSNLIYVLQNFKDYRNSNINMRYDVAAVYMIIIINKQIDIFNQRIDYLKSFLKQSFTKKEQKTQIKKSNFIQKKVKQKIFQNFDMLQFI